MQIWQNKSYLSTIYQQEVHLTSFRGTPKRLRWKLNVTGGTMASSQGCEAGRQGWGSCVPVESSVKAGEHGIFRCENIPSFLGP